ncbi:MAG: LicD family protein [Campylobacter sp.]|nr:LicD family protein [Campylobacter sp.]
MQNLRQMQLEMVKMIDQINKLFKENDIRYTLLGGSVLGAIRHKGFIPWDDDMDIAVWRKDFEKAENLLANLKPYTYEFARKHIIPDAPTGHLHLINEKYTLELSPTIDVFALDMVPNNKIERKKVQFMANIFMPQCIESHRKIVENLINLFLQSFLP